MGDIQPILSYLTLDRDELITLQKPLTAFNFQLLSSRYLEMERVIYVQIYSYEDLALLGDIGWTRDERLFQWLNRQPARCKRVFFFGSYRLYGSSLVEHLPFLSPLISLVLTDMIHH